MCGRFRFVKKTILRIKKKKTNRVRRFIGFFSITLSIFSYDTCQSFSHETQYYINANM